VKPSNRCAIALSLLAFAAARAAAQAPPGPLPGVPPSDGSSRAAEAPRPAAPRTRDLRGTWRLNRDESDDARKKMQQSRGGTRGSSGGRPGWPGGRSGYGGRRPDPEEREKLATFVEPAERLSIVGQDPEIRVRDDADRTLTLFTDGRKVEKSKDPAAQQLDAKWEDYRLVLEGKDPGGNKYQRSYEVLEGNQQLRETLLLRVGRRQTEVAIHYLYDLVARAKS